MFEMHEVYQVLLLGGRVCPLYQHLYQRRVQRFGDTVHMVNFGLTHKIYIILTRLVC